MIYISRPTRTRTWELPRPPVSPHQFSSLLSPSEAVNVALPCHSPSRRVPLRVAPDAPRRREEPDFRPCLSHLMKMLFLFFLKDYLVVSKVLAVACLPVVGGRALYTRRKIDIIVQPHHTISS